MKGKLKITLELDGGNPPVADFIAEFNLPSAVLNRLQALAGLVGLKNLATIVFLGFETGSLMMLQEQAEVAMRKLKIDRGYKGVSIK